ncbi:MAG: lipid kinase [Prevotella sp.]|nr:lipid kinase [Prevotella sp.]
MSVDTNKWGILFCPKSGAIRPQSKWEKVEKCLKERGVSYDFVQSENSNSVERLVKMMINNGYKTIVIVGGDSALNEAVNCMMQIPKEERDDVHLGVIPNGLMNDFAHFWDIRENDIENNIDMLIKHRVRKVDLGCIRYKNTKNDNCHRYFLNCLSIGLVASVIQKRRRASGPFGWRKLTFIPSSLLMIFQRLEYKMRLRINSDIIDRKVMTVCVGNAQGYGFTPSAVPYNGLLDVSVVYHPEVAQLIEGFYLLFSGKILNHKSVHPFRTTEIIVEKAERALIGIDGRLMNSPVGPFKVNVEQEVINFIIPS